MSRRKHFYINTRKMDVTGEGEVTMILNYDDYSYITNNVRKYIIETGATANWPSIYNSNMYYCRE
jgi:hypothetical protein